jgi:hypothetical protein
LTVIKYCFALVSPQHSEIDFRVGEFPSLEHALHLAEFIASDLSIERKWSGWSIEVRNIEGRQLFAIAVPDGELVTP